jgi:hypothetical protein
MKKFLSKAYLALVVSTLAGFLVSCQSISPENLAVSEQVLNGDKIAWEKDGVTVWPGLYSGYLYLGESKKAFPFESNFVFQRNSNGMIKAKAIVTALQGSYTSHEYSSHYFPFVDIYPQSGAVVFKGKGDVTFSDVKLNGKVFSGKVNVRGVSGEFLTIWNEKQVTARVSPSTSIQKELTSSYRGECLGQPMIINVKTKKLSVKRKDNSFMSLPVVAEVFGEGRRACAGVSGVCKKFSYRGFTDLAKQTIQFYGNNHQRKCEIRGRSGALDCGGCVFVRDKTDESSNSVSFSSDINEFKSLIKSEDFRIKVPAEKVSGNYRGFLVDKNKGVIQPMFLSVRNHSKEGRDYLSGSAKHYWQNKINNHYTQYQFVRMRYVKDRSVFVFDGNTDGLFYVTGFYENGLVGDWYSKSSGYLGNVYLKKGVAWSELPVKKSSSLVHFKYQGKDANVKIRMKPAVSKSYYDFFPNKLYGATFENGSKKPTAVYVGGVLDRRSGYVALLKTDKTVETGILNENELALYGEPTPNDLLRKKMVSVAEYSSGSNRETIVVAPSMEIKETEIKQANKFESLLKKLDNKAVKPDGQTLF